MVQETSINVTTPTVTVELIPLEVLAISAFDEGNLLESSSVEVRLGNLSFELSVREADSLCDALNRAKIEAQNPRIAVAV